MKGKENKYWRIGLTVAFTVAFLWLINFIAANAYAVLPLPGGNLITNPWFRDFSDPTKSALDGWTDAAGKNKYWSSSQKESNPSPDIFVSGVCGGDPVYCGTGARLSITPGQSGGVAVPNIDAYLYQVVPATAAHKYLWFSTYWVSHRVDIAEVIIYGSNSPNGPWMSVWVPFHHIQTSYSSEPDLWQQTALLEKPLSQGYSYYKIMIHARLPEGIQTGFKISGIYFSTESTGGKVPEIPTPTAPGRDTNPGPEYESYLPLVLTLP